MEVVRKKIRNLGVEYLIWQEVVHIGVDNGLEKGDNAGTKRSHIDIVASTFTTTSG